jgi:hypothetical protein
MSRSSDLYDAHQRARFMRPRRAPLDTPGRGAVAQAAASG